MAGCLPDGVGLPGVDEPNWRAIDRQTAAFVKGLLPELDGGGQVHDRRSVHHSARLEESRVVDALDPDAPDHVDNLDLARRELRLGSEGRTGNPPEAMLELGKRGADSTWIVRRCLRDRWKDTEALFPSRQSDRTSKRSVARRIDRLAEIGDVEPRVGATGTGDPNGVTPHTLRHSVARRIIRDEGGRREDVQLRQRHADLATPDRVYSHLRAR